MKIQRNEVVCRATKGLARIILPPFYNMQLIGAENIPEEGAVIVASKHRYGFDLVATGYLSEGVMSCPAKRELFDGITGKLIGWYLKMLGGFPIDRKRPSKNSILHMGHCIDRGEALLIYPEGKRFHDSLGNGELGLARILEMMNERERIPVIPMGSYYSKKPWPPLESVVPWKRTRIVFCAGEAIYRREETRKEFTQRLMSKIGECCVAAENHALGKAASERAYPP